MSATEKFGHYEVQKREDGSLCELGQGAMGVSYKAFDTNLRFPVCLKVINSAHLNSDEARQRVIREARSAANLRHRNVASLFHLGTEGDTWFYAMEFINGETLDAVIKREGTLAPRAALEITAQVARALNAATQHGLVHRDIKPANLMLVKEDDEIVVKVVEFGLVRSALGVVGDDAATLSLGGFVGTPHFASPEHWDGRGIDIRSDIYSLGVTLWYMLTGEIPFSGSTTQVMTQHFSKSPPFEKLKGTPAPVVDILRKTLAKDPAERFQTPSELRKAIEAVLAVGNAAAPLPPSAPFIEQQENFPQASSAALGNPVNDAQPSNFNNDDDLQFTVFRPEEVPLNSWRDLLAFAHLTSKRPDAPADEPEPLAEVERQARQFLGDELEHYTKLSQDGTVAFPRDGEITFEPELEGAEFNPARVTFRWKEAVHREAFRFRILEGTMGSHSRGRLNVFLGPFLAATVPLRIKIVGETGNTAPKTTKRQTAAAYRNIFVSYSHRDWAIVEICQHYAKAFGDRFLRDCVDLRTGEQWNPKLLALIEKADVFQLFWSASASSSQYVRQEVAHALKLDREGFIRPTYWEKDLPSPWRSDPDISTLHFERLPFRSDVDGPSPNKEATKAVRMFGKCQNLAGCLLAYRGEEIQVEKGHPFVCAQCGNPLVEAKPPSTMWLRYLNGVVAVGVLCVAALFAFPQLGGVIEKHKHEKGETTSEAKPPENNGQPDSTANPTSPDVASTTPTSPITPPPDSGSSGAAEPIAAVTAPPMIDLDPSKGENKDVRNEVLTRIDMMPGITAGNKDKLYQSVERARSMGKVLTIPFASGRAELSQADLQTLKGELEKPEVTRLRDDPTAVFVILGYADPKGDPKKNMFISQSRADSVLRAMKDKCGVSNVLHSVAMGGSKLVDAQNLEKDRIVEIWAVLP